MIELCHPLSTNPLTNYWVHLFLFSSCWCLLVLLPVHSHTYAAVMPNVFLYQQGRWQGVHVLLYVYMWCRGNRPSSEDLRVEDGLMRFLEYLHSVQYKYVIQQAGTNKNLRKVCLAKETPAPSITVLLEYVQWTFVMTAIGQWAEMALNTNKMLNACKNWPVRVFLIVKSTCFQGIFSCSYLT